MTYKAKAFVCSESITKHSTKLEHLVVSITFIFRLMHLTF